MNDDVTSKTTWAQRLNFIKNLKEILSLFRLLELKILVYMALPIYWAIIILATFSH